METSLQDFESKINSAIQELIADNPDRALEILSEIQGELEFMSLRNEDKMSRYSVYKKASVDDARIYVGTYGKYNSGSIDGAWLDLSDYSDINEFYEAANKLHSDEADPELMFQDWEGIPKWAIDESYLSPKWFEYRDAVEDLDEDAFNIYVEEVFGDRLTEDSDFQQLVVDFEDSYQGEFKDMEDFAYSLVDDLGIDNIGNIDSYFDYDGFVRDLGFDGWSVADEEDAEKYPEDYPEGPGVYDPSGELYGGYDSLTELAESWMDEGVIGEEQKKLYFDYGKFARDLEYGGDYYEKNGYVFRRV